MKPSQNKLLIIFNALLFAGFLFFPPWGAYAASIFTAGWYQDHGGVEDYSCPSGFWRASVELKDYLGEPLAPDELIVQAVWYQEGTDLGIIIYEGKWNNSTTSVFETDCAIEIKNAKDTIILDIRAKKDGFHAMKAANLPRTAGSSLNRSKWSKTLHMASLTTEEANLVYLFPDNNQWISGKGEQAEMKLWVNKEPRPENITEINTEIIHSSSGDKLYQNIKIDISQGEVVFSLPALTGIGQYSWQAKSVRSTPSIFYNENGVSFFNFDPNSPILDYRSHSRSRSGKLQAPHISVRFKDEPIPSSGMRRIELYLNDGPSTPLELVRTCTSASPVTSYWCSYTGTYEEYLVSKTYTYYAIGYDFVGNETKIAEASFTVSPLSPSYLDISSRVNNSLTTGVPFAVTNVYNVVGEGEPGIGYPATGTYATNKEFVGTVDSYTITLEAPESHNDRPFSFWMYSGFCYNDPLSWQVHYASSYILTMHFGVSRLMIRRRLLTNAGSISSDLDTKINQIKTRIEQTGGTPSSFLSSSGYIDVTGNQVFYETVVGEINNLRLKFNDSEDDILKFSSFAGNFCQTTEGRECEGSAIYQCRTMTPRYAINRKVRVEAYLGSSLAGGVAIEGSGGMQSGTTTLEGYYSFSSTAHPSGFSGTLRAPETILNDEGEVVEFGYWEGCDPRPPGNDEFDCYIGTDTWYYNVSVTAKARYSSSADEPNVDCGELPNNACVPGEPPWYCEEGTLRRYCITCGCPSGQICIDDGAYGYCVSIYALSVNSDPIQNIPLESTTGHSSTTNYKIPGVIQETSVILSAPLTHVHEGITYQFREWTGDCDTKTNSTCELIMDSDKTVTVKYSGVTAAMECQIPIIGSGTGCRGPGCVCDNTFSETWQTFHNSDVLYKVINKSTSTNPAIDIVRSHWSVGAFDMSCNYPNSLCDMTIPFSETSIGNHNINLEVEDEMGGIASTSHQIIIKRDVSVDFQCSLDNSVWEPCEDFALLTGQGIYFMGQAMHSEGATDIIEWLWERGDGTNFAQFSSGSSTASTTLSVTTSTVRLTVIDDHPGDAYYLTGRRSVSGSYNLSVRFPLPEYREVRPRSQLDNFLARIAGIFR